MSRYAFNLIDKSDLYEEHSIRWETRGRRVRFTAIAASFAGSRCHLERLLVQNYRIVGGPNGTEH